MTTEFLLTLTAGGGAELEDLSEGETVWTSQDDEDFREEFPDFLQYDDVADILDYLEEIGELTGREADRCEIREESLRGERLAGLMRQR